MARDVLIQQTCDWCRQLDLPATEATTEHTLAINGRPAKRFDFCPPHDLMVQPLIALFEEEGVELEQKRPRQVDALQLPALEQGAEEEEKYWVTCPLDHQDGKTDRSVSYKTRSSHAKNSHEMGVWEIAWGDPGGKLTVFCTSHQECMDTKLAFENEGGKAQHNRLCPLERIDL